MSNEQIIIRINIQGDILDSDDLPTVAGRHGLVDLKNFLTANNLRATRVVNSVPVNQLLERERRARRTKFPPLRSLTHYWRIDASGVSAAGDMANALGELKRDVSLAYVEAPAGPVCAALPTGNSETMNSYLDPAPDGVDAYWAWNQWQGKGEDVKVIDIETGWILEHEDLPEPKLLCGDNESNQYGAQDHGAAVMGVIGAIEDDKGITGIAPSLASLHAMSHYRAIDHSRYHVADAISLAISCLCPGDILLLEVARYPDNGSDSFPTESDYADQTAIRSAVAAGIVVIEAAGNAGKNLDDYSSDYSGVTDLNRLSPNFVDSGAIMVGAGTSRVSGDPPGHERLDDSNFGNRVDCYAWGDSIHTAGYGDMAGTEGGLTSYTRVFHQTSGASAIIAGVATVVQSWAKSRCKRPLSSARMRTILSSSCRGTPQVFPDPGAKEPIGVMPNLRKILRWTTLLFNCIWRFPCWILRSIAMAVRIEDRFERRE